MIMQIYNCVEAGELTASFFCYGDEENGRRYKLCYKYSKKCVNQYCLLCFAYGRDYNENQGNYSEALRMYGEELNSYKMRIHEFKIEEMQRWIS